jgi:hypothetical protein
VVVGFIMWLDDAAAAGANLLSLSLVHPVAINPCELLQLQQQPTAALSDDSDDEDSITNASKGLSADGAILKGSIAEIISCSKAQIAAVKSGRITVLQNHQWTQSRNGELSILILPTIAYLSLII